jgi:purine-nucleoside phosphorylase
MSEVFEELRNAARATPAEVALVLGSGLGAVVERIEPVCRVGFADIPGLSAVSVAGHAGRLTLGVWVGRRVLVYEGRLHYYEGHTWEEVTKPVLIASTLGVRTMIFTNAVGGIHDDLDAGSFLLVRDQMQLTVPNWWRESGPGGLGPPRPSPYTPSLVDALSTAGRKQGVRFVEGRYAAVTGPCYETPAEIRALKAWGADAVGMSTAREVQAGFELGLECATISCVTNRAAGLSGGPLSHEEVLATAAAQSHTLAAWLEAYLELLAAS